MCNRTKICQYNFDNHNPTQVCDTCLTNLNRLSTLDRDFDRQMDDDVYRDLADEVYADMMWSITGDVNK